MEGLVSEIAPFGIRPCSSNPASSAPSCLSPQSTQHTPPSIADYADRTGATIEAWQGMDGKQGGDPAKLADALIQLAAMDQHPFRFAAGADAVELVESKAHTLLAQAAAHRDLSRSLADDDS